MKKATTATTASTASAFNSSSSSSLAARSCAAKAHRPWPSTPEEQLPLGNLNEAVWIRSTTAALQNHWIPWVYHSLPVQRATIWTICLCGDVLYQPTMSYKHCEVLPSTDRISSGHLVTVGDGGVWPQEKKKQLLRPNLPQHCNNWVWLKLAVPNGPTRLQTGCVQN